MKIKELNRVAKIVDKGNQLQESIEELECALESLKNNPATRISIAVCEGEYIMPVSEYLGDVLSKALWCEVIQGRIYQLKKEFKQLKFFNRR